MYSKLTALTANCEGMPLDVFKDRFNKWDVELGELMRASEEKCHKFMDGRIEYFPELGTWFTRRFTLHHVRAYIKGKVPDPRNLFKKCEKQKIPRPDTMTLDDVALEISECNEKIEGMRTQAPK
jgi:hypothetical protein